MSSEYSIESHSFTCTKNTGIPIATFWAQPSFSPLTTAGIADTNRATEKPDLRQVGAQQGVSAMAVHHSLPGEFAFYCEGAVPLLFTGSESIPGMENEAQGQLSRRSLP